MQAPNFTDKGAIVLWNMESFRHETFLITDRSKEQLNRLSNTELVHCRAVHYVGSQKEHTSKYDIFMVI